MRSAALKFLDVTIVPASDLRPKAAGEAAAAKQPGAFHGAPHVAGLRPYARLVASHGCGSTTLLSVVLFTGFSPGTWDMLRVLL